LQAAATPQRFSLNRAPSTPALGSEWPSASNPYQAVAAAAAAAVAAATANGPSPSPPGAVQRALTPPTPMRQQQALQQLPLGTSPAPAAATLSRVGSQPALPARSPSPPPQMAVPAAGLRREPSQGPRKPFQRPFVPKLALGGTGTQQQVPQPMPADDGPLPSPTDSCSTLATCCSFGAGDPGGTQSALLAASITAAAAAGAAEVPDHLVAQGGLAAAAAASVAGQRPAEVLQGSSEEALRLENAALWEQVRDLKELSQRLLHAHVMAGGGRPAEAQPGSPAWLLGNGAAVEGGCAQAGTGEVPAIEPQQYLLQQPRPCAPAVPSSSGLTLQHPLKPWPPLLEEGSGLSTAGGKGSLSAQLSSLKAQMAAVEAQGEALRAATRTVEDECRKMVFQGGTNLWPTRPQQTASAGGG